ncbi:transcription initiation factor TFIID subunit 9-like [Lytechinus variegatus]|uniref:transcription initiation factor TFIID subunit 9-like n=1 Tax=Lytechinus variegatus TaxID=7654 RepID=UPI001BB137B9|nr:transcription initiation factor TFIID subunit 9-like [Lytechinus variegatus]
MASSNKTQPRDAEIMTAILKDMGVTDYEPRVINQMLEFAYRYVTDVLDDSQVYSGHAGRRDIDVEDIKLAIQTRLDHSFTTPPPREFLMEIAKQKNSSPLPAIKPHNGPRLPPDRYCLSSCNYRLKPPHKRPTLTLPSRLSLGSSIGSKPSPTFSIVSKSSSFSLKNSSSSYTMVTQSPTVSKPAINIISGLGSSLKGTSSNQSDVKPDVKPGIIDTKAGVKRKREEND